MFTAAFYTESAATCNMIHSKHCMRVRNCTWDQNKSVPRHNETNHDPSSLPPPSANETKHHSAPAAACKAMRRARTCVGWLS